MAGDDDQWLEDMRARIGDEMQGRDKIRRKSDMGSWVQTAIAAVGITAAFFAWYTNQNSRANAEMAVNKALLEVEQNSEVHDEKGGSHFEYRDKVDDQIQALRESAIKRDGSIERIEAGVTAAATSVAENRKDIKEILRVVRQQSGD